MSERGKVRQYSAKEKLQILEEGRQTGASISEVCRRHGISTAHFYQWEKQAKDAVLERFQPRKPGRKSTDEKALRLEAENQRLKNVIAEITSENLELKKNFIP